MEMVEAQLQQQIQALEKYLKDLEACHAQGIVTEGEVMAEILLTLINELVEEVAFQIHRSVKLKMLCLCTHPVPPNHTHEGLVNLPGYDIYGRKMDKQNPPNFLCPNCGVLRQAAKFAAHLEKCMGLGGRESRRGATGKRQAGNGVATAHFSFAIEEPAPKAARKRTGIQSRGAGNGASQPQPTVDAAGKRGRRAALTDSWEPSLLDPALDPL